MPLTIGVDAPLLSTTLANYRAKLHDNVIRAIPLFAWLTANNRKITLDGGEQIVVPLLHGRSTAVGSYDTFDTLDISEQQGIGAAVFPWRNLYGSVVIDGPTMRKNAGRSQVINLLQAKIEQAELSLREEVEIEGFSDGTGNNSRDLIGLQAAVTTTPTTGTYAGIDRSVATNAFWRNRTGTTVTDYSANGNVRLTALYNTCSIGTDHPDFLISTQATFENYEATLTAVERFTPASNPLGDAGFQILKFKGAMWVFSTLFPTAITNGGIYVLNSRWLNWTVNQEADFATTEFQRAPNQDVWVAFILIQGNLVCSAPRMQGIITGTNLD